MRAFAVPAQGEQPAHLDVDTPEPDTGEARVRINAASVNGFDLAVAAGYMAGFFEHRYPLVLGREFSGVVDAVADGVDLVQLGDRVFGVVSKPYLREGAFAEYTTVVVDGGSSSLRRCSRTPRPRPSRTPARPPSRASPRSATWRARRC